MSRSDEAGTADPGGGASGSSMPGRRDRDAEEGEAPRRSAATTPARRLLSRILAINMLAPILLVGGLLYLDEYRDSLLEQNIRALIVQGELIAGALSEAAVSETDGRARIGAGRAEIQQLPSAGDPLDDQGAPGLNVAEARPIVRRIAAATDMDLRLFAADGALVADSRALIGSGRGVMALELPPPEADDADAVEGILQWLYDQYTLIFPTYENLPPRVQNIVDEATDYEEALYALDGEVATGLRAATDNRLVITVAIPVQGLRRIVGAVLLETDSRAIDDTVRQQRLNVLQLFVLVLALTVLLSVFLARTIARPVRRLARAAEQVHAGRGRRVVIPDFTGRGDEIGELSGSLRDMTDALYRRIDAIERFAADVAHELRNPLTSLRSAVETLELARSPEQKQRLMEIVYADVGRIDRLISDISDASRLDAELGRAEEEVVDINAMLSALAEVYRNTRGMEGPDGRRLDLQLPAEQLRVRGIEGRLGQVFRNLIDNALSFSPPQGVIAVRALRRDGRIVVSVQDQGPGIPPENIGRIFQRFFTERPPQETFGEHSGLGLAICKQIVEAMGGTIEAGNATDAGGNVLGARFVVTLPG
ncbi:stimulus-sensing domain-containing protein [Marinibaculum pumilum]|uniref:histidine kinase n=1 Tax=Marinibaculum pumilum TaxID=1766165 RepID=A0ABV7L0B4_9PROT